MSVQAISPSSVVSRISEIYRDQRRVLIGTALSLYAIEFVLDLLGSTAASLALLVLFWVVSTLYQGMVVKLVRTSRTAGAITQSPVLSAASSRCSGHS